MYYCEGITQVKLEGTKLKYASGIGQNTCGFLCMTPRHAFAQGDVIH